MPRSDNLYSAEDSEVSDHESFSEELSPSDGYFNRGNVPANMVQDPSLSKDDKAEDKTLIPPPSVQSRTDGSSRTSLHSVLPRSLPSHNYASRRSDNASNSSDSPSSYNPTSPVSSRRTDEMLSERSALIHGPPPAYSPSPDVPRSPQELDGRSYSTFPEHQLERGSLPAREPESMGGPIEVEPDERTPLSSEPKPDRASICRRFIKKIIFIVLFVVIVISLTTALLGRSSSNSKFPSKDPSKAPSELPDLPKDPVEDMPPFDGPVDADGPYCRIATHKNAVVTYEFPVGHDLTVLQTTHGDRHQNEVPIYTLGEIRLRRLPKDSQHGNSAYFTLDVHVSDPDLEVIKTWDEDSRLLKVSTPRYARYNSAGRHNCVSVGITAWFPEDADFSDLLIESVTLTLRVMDDIKVKVSRRSKFATIDGNIVFPTIATPFSHDVLDMNSSTVPSFDFEHPFASRRIVVGTVSGSITGTYPLMDLLSLTSSAGQINVDVNPQKVLKAAPAPAELEVETSSGSIKVNCPIHYIPPPRNYVTRVHSNAGSIDGSFYLGSLSNFATTAGSIQLEGLPVLQTSTNTKDRSNFFQTRTINGGTRVQVLDPIFISSLSPSEQPVQKDRPDHLTPIVDGGDPFLTIPPNINLDQNLFELSPRSEQKLDSLDSIHSSSSSSVEVLYPGNWEGTLHAKTVSGSITARGEGIRIVREKNGYASKELVARKGAESSKEGSFVDMSTVAGSLGFVVGE